MSEIQVENQLALDQILERQVKTTIESYQDFISNPFDIEHTHQLRVNLRKLRAQYHFLKDNLAKKDYRRINSPLRQLGRILNPLREIDVFTELVTKLWQEETDLIDNYPDVLLMLHDEKVKCMGAVLAQIRKFAWEEVVYYIEDLNSTILNRLQNIDASAPLEEVLQARLHEIVASLEVNYRDLDREDYEAVHEIRKSAKKARYNFTTYSDLLEDEIIKTNVQYAKNIQTDLGHLTDQHVNELLFEHFREEAKDKKLRKAFTQLLKHS